MIRGGEGVKHIMKQHWNEKDFALARWGFININILMNSSRKLCQISWNVAFALELIFAWSCVELIAGKRLEIIQAWTNLEMPPL